MAFYTHPDVLDNGLSELTGAGKSLVVCQGEPLTLQDATDLLSGLGMRVSSVITLDGADITLEAGSTPNSRRITYAAKSGTVAESVEAPTTPDLWIAVYDGTRLLLVTDEVTDQELVAPNPLNIPSFRITFRQPVAEV